MATTPGNSIGETITGITGFTGTAFVGTPVTQYNVLTGASTSSTLNNVAPSATSGVPLISQGAAIQPAFGTAVVAGGGTGATSFTAYSVITGGTTSTGPLQNVSGVGTASQVLTSNGASTLPTWQTPSIPPINTASVQIYEDFFGYVSSTTGNFLTAGWLISATGFIGYNTVVYNTNPGTLGNQSLSSGDASLYLFTNIGFGETPQILLGGGIITYTWIIRTSTLSTASNRYILKCGLFSAITGEPNDGVYFLYSDNVNSGNWVGKTASGGSRTSANSSNAAVNNAFVNLTITINAAASSVAFYFNGTQIANSPLSATIPTVAISPAIILSRSAGTIAANSVLVDLFTLNQTLTTPR